MTSTATASTTPAVDREVAETPDGDFHFEMGRTLAERLGYAPASPDRIPDAAIESAGLVIRPFREPLS